MGGMIMAVCLDPFSSSLSKHAAVRMQQRGIPESVLLYLLQFGAVQHDHRGARIVYFNKASRRQAAEAGAYQQIPNFDRFDSIYAVVTIDGLIKTVSRRYKRILRH